LTVSAGGSGGKRSARLKIERIGEGACKMAKASFRFYEELNEYLPENRRKVDFEVRLEGRRVLKDIIAALGVPPAEIDLILANGRSVDFDYIPGDGDRISVYPVFESFNIGSVTRLRAVPLRKTRFIAASNLSAVAESLRRMGCDVICQPALSEREIIAISNREKRIILTADKELLQCEGVTRAILIRPGPAGDQVRKIAAHLDIKSACGHPPYE